MRPVAALLLALALAGCSSMLVVYHVEDIHDDFDNYTINRMDLNELSGGNPLDLGLGDRVELNLQRYVSDDTGFLSYSMVANYSGEDWIFIEPGESLILLVDGERVGFVGDGSIDSRSVGAGTCFESALYRATYEGLQRIAAASKVRVKIRGSDGILERHLSGTNLKNFRKFLEEYPPDAPPEGSVG